MGLFHVGFQNVFCETFKHAGLNIFENVLRFNASYFISGINSGIYIKYSTYV